MPAFIDMTGRKFGRWTVLSRTDEVSGLEKKWRCRCDCGVERLIIGSSLRKGQTCSCGCYKADKEAALREKIPKQTALPAIQTAGLIAQPTQEEWRPTLRHPGYEVSSIGRVRRPLRGKRALAQGRRWRYLSPSLSQHGYYEVHLGGKGGRTVHIHRLVLEAFTGHLPAKGVCCRHLNDVKSDNRVSNLCWGSYAENYADRFVNGIAIIGSKHCNAKYSEAEIADIRRRRSSGQTLAEIAKVYGTDKSGISKITLRKTWKYCE